MKLNSLVMKTNHGADLNVFQRNGEQYYIYFIIKQDERRLLLFIFMFILLGFAMETQTALTVLMKMSLFITAPHRSLAAKICLHARMADALTK